MINNKLEKLDFAPGIKARDINRNFEALSDSINRERKRVGGYGIIDGFDIVTDPQNFTVTVKEGIMISRAGDELIVPDETFAAGAPDYVLREEHIICPADGVISLADIPYSPSAHGYAKYVPPVDKLQPSKNEFSIVCPLEDRTVPYIQLRDNTVYINNPTYWYGKELVFTYYVAGDRVDAILIHEDGTYRYEKSIASKNPSHVSIDDYEGGDGKYMMVGVIHWIVGENVSTAVYTNHRSYRPVYTHDDNQLYIYGKEYKEPRVILFEEPKEPEPQDMWCDLEHDVLLVYKFKDGEYGWDPVNDFSTVTMRETKIWSPEEWPEARQTFLFGKDDLNLNFVPNTNALEVYVDNAVLMKDQFMEIVSSARPGSPDYMSQGIGFRLVEPMDRPTFLQVTVNHQVKTSPIREVFQRAAIFVVENHAYQTTVNSRQIYKTEYPYVIGAQQLEVWVDGMRLVPDVEFEELKDDTTRPTDDEKVAGSLMSHYFVIKKPLEAGQLVDHKISKHIWSYDQVSILLDDIREEIKDQQNITSKMKIDFDALNENLTSQVASLSNQASALRNDLDELANKKMPDEAIEFKHLKADIKKKLFGGKTCCTSMSATRIEPIDGFTKDDFLQVFLISAEESRILIKAIDYTLTDTDNGVRVDLQPEFITSGNTICVTGFTIGVA